ncbi:MAG: hypothetical protein A2Y62_13775 [Candidatus Fischerbacteria bacterium RBG_13_37_8]|uniref:Uncharacterized protein n=1 Tax=Candidatus Fischerbacteria bacterium RBG_13_37_8 TaxID=1817863 RepID=A0A1F5VXF1_9BACT|nr:MAG: hypothetical protein A2Y62_13775 [Candidatus Fischerbacteria bacterium RBG_13_37_8]
MCAFDNRASIANYYLVVLCIIAVILVNEAIAGDSSSASSWAQGYTLILMSNKDISEANEARDYVISQGGAIAILSPPHVMLGWIPAGISDKLLGKNGIEFITQSPIDIRGLKYQDEQSIAFINFFNYVASGDMEKEREASATAKGEPLINDALPHPGINREDFERNLQQLGIESFSWNNSDEMTGTVAYALFFVESNGTKDTSQYDWTAVDQQNTINRASSGLSWWVNKAVDYGVTLSFTPRIYPYNGVAAQQGYEPITHFSTEDSLWINQIMDNLGYTSGDKFEKVTAFNSWLKIQYKTNWAFSVFIAYNPLGAPTKFKDSIPTCAYSYLGGPYVQMLFRNCNWGEAAFGTVLSHETGHVFWACDEYYDFQDNYGCTSCGACAADGPRPTIVNANCEYCNINSVPCMMRHNEDALCPQTPKHIGWCAAFKKIYSDLYNGGLAEPGELDLAQDGGFCWLDWNIILKLDSCGNIIWKRDVDSKYVFHSIAATSDGGCIASGYRELPDYPAPGGFIAKFNSSGNVTWKREYGHDSVPEDESLAVTETNNGNYVTAGFMWNPNSNSVNCCYECMLITAFNSPGNIIWRRSFNELLPVPDDQNPEPHCHGYNNSQAYAVAPTLDGGVIMISTGNLVLKLNASGGLLWRRKFIGVGELNSITQTKDGGYIIAGWIPGSGGSDFFIVKLDNFGNVIWKRSIGGTGWDKAHSIIPTSDGGYIVSGGSGSFDSQYGDILLVKLNSSGNISLSRIFEDSSDNDWGKVSLEQTLDGGYAIEEGYLLKLDSKGLFSGCELISPLLSITVPSFYVSAPALYVEATSLWIWAPSFVMSAPTMNVYSNSCPWPP